jgi:RimJ/RimL family protein N-acetyltransferase
MWKRSDAPLLKQAIDASRTELAHWTPWVLPNPDKLSVLERRLDNFVNQFEAREQFIYAIEDRATGQLLGGIGLYNRIAPGVLEIGYWMRSDVTGRGYATEASEALMRVAFIDCEVTRLEIRVDPNNARSVAIPKRLGFRHRETFDRDPLFPNEQRQMAAWEMLSSEYSRRY